jgi:hypothetical protein
MAPWQEAGMPQAGTLFFYITTQKPPLQVAAPLSVSVIKKHVE